MQLWDNLTTAFKSSGHLAGNKAWAAASSVLLLCAGKQMKAMVLLHDLVTPLFREGQDLKGEKTPEHPFQQDFS